MCMSIEHPDHTGASSNPLAPWNQPDALPVQCEFCHEESDTLEVGDTCEECGEPNAMREGEPFEPDWDSMPGGHDDY